MLTRTISLYKNAYGGLSRATWLLALVILVNRSGTMVIPFMTLYLTQPSMGYSIGQAGTVIAIFGLGAVCGGWLGGRLTDKWGFHRVQMVTLGGGGILFIVLGQMRSYPLICGCTFLLSVVNEAFRPANSTAIAAYSKEEYRTRSFSLNRLAINLGWAFGGALGGLLASFNFHLLFWVDGITNLLAVLLLRSLLGPASAAVIARHRNAEEGPARSPYRDKVYLIFIGCTIVFAACFFQIFSVLPVFYKQVGHLSELMIGMLLTVNGLFIVIFEMVVVFKMEGRKENLVYIMYGNCLVGSAFVVLNIFPVTTYLAYSSMLLISMGEMMSMPFLNSFWVSRTTAANRGRYAGLNTIAWSTAQVIGPATGAEVAQHVGFRTLWWGVAGCCVVAAAGFRWLRHVKSMEHA
jgi:predicted MFS family arabinose efflux permease